MAVAAPPAPAPPVAGTGRRRVPRAVVVILTAAAVLAATVVVVATALAPRPAVGPGSRVAVVGDSYSAGTPVGGLGPANWAFRLAERRGWAVTDTAIAGTGYLRSRVDPDGSLERNYAAAQLDQALAVQPDLLVVQGSLNDATLPADQVAAAASSLYAEVHRRSPLTRLVVIGPAWPDDAPTAEIVLVRDELGRAARAAGATWIDPMTEGWFENSPALIGGDHLHPTDDGHRLMADRVGDDLARAGL